VGSAKRPYDAGIALVDESDEQMLGSRILAPAE